ncbi:YopX family protein [Streptococcus cristatus]|uniref:YopX family protein n=1 Tax=Streptococcus cristatus TaxID=45634 RepID=UPI0028D8DC07|nr:YopX family protein [Streptococcus cristatus]
MIPKFRAWLKGDKEMVDVDEIAFRTNWIRVFYELNYYWFKFDDVKLMQSTGLFDKNGREIFEGDIVQFEDCYTESDFLYINKGIVEWSQGSFTVTNRDSVEMEDLLDGEILDVTIIGNIYENEALLEVNHDTI